MATEPDWEQIKKEYRAGQLSNVMLGKKFGVSESAIRKRAKKEGWQKDLASDVRKRVREKLVRDEVRDPNANDDEVVDSVAATGVSVVRAHRADIRAASRMAEMLMAQLLDAASRREELEEAIHEETKDDESTRRRTSMLKAVSLPTHAGVVRDLSAAMKNLIPLERQAYNLDETNAEETYEERLKRLMSKE
ncbi:hypothetical protein BXT89_14435 [Halopseudomonas pachastrellae]|uniref:Terminase small subunit n=1 Tax=Halopseudomonas pachastrellae TaxID=254161 RepID=A0A1S8DEA9_9GAMM|nr:hypothetical protein [Halopseudomonas pachastrellae]ONM43146.1 hypothetical protein BXT89_14435 [Halopseudomonas pachastrellae]SFL71584.1 hypothetical protein SAMN05216256_101109 [Halopseudomonas pachastrellae]